MSGNLAIWRLAIYGYIIKIYNNDIILLLLLLLIVEFQIFCSI